MTLSFWYLLQEALWNVDYGDDTAESALEDWAESIQGNQGSRQASEEPKSNPSVATPIYAELVQVLKRKVTWPGKAELATWTKGSSTCSLSSPAADKDVSLRSSRQIPSVCIIINLSEFPT